MKNIICTLAFLTAFASAKSVEYNLTIAGEKVNVTGRIVTGMTINGGIPGPTLRFTEGDTFSDPLNILALGWEAGWEGTEGTAWEVDLTYGRYFNRFTPPFAGVYVEGVDSTRGDERAIAGIRYLLPGNFQSQAWIDDKGEARFTLERELMLTPRPGVFGEVEYDTLEKWSYQAGMSDALPPYLSTTALWDSEHGLGAGLTFRF